jgi:glycosyltransferase involved in cell wall biosynthesis
MPGVKVLGTVPDVRPFYQQARVAVVPSLYGGMTKLKVLEAMAMGVPVVSTSWGCKGFDVADGRNIFIADDAEPFGERIVELLRDGAHSEAMAQAGRALVEQKYSWRAIVEGAVRLVEAADRARSGRGKTVARF